LAGHPGVTIIADRIRRGGFTLIELLVVLVIVSVVSAFVGPKLAGSLTNMDLRTAAKGIASSLRYARSQAASQSATYLALFDLDKGRLTVGPDEREGIAEADGEKVETAESQAELKHFDLPEGVRIQKAMVADQEALSGLFLFTFFADGGSSGGTVVLSNKRGHAYSVAVDFITGTVEVSEGAKDA
jgi:general secretion pathway protein H